MALMVSVSGIRGIFGSHLTPENLVTYTAAFGTWLNGGTVVVGRDSRVTGQLCEDIVCATLQSTGCDVIKVGIAPTPTVAMGVLKHDAAGGIILTASHNPAEWNALKLINHKSEFLDSGQGNEIIKLAEKRTFTYQKFDQIGTIEEDNEAVDYHIQKILELPYIDKGKLRFRHYEHIDQTFPTDHGQGALYDVTLKKKEDRETISDTLPAIYHATELYKNIDKVHREELVSQCMMCHQLGNSLTRTPRSHEAWLETVTRMEGMASLLTFSGKEEIVNSLHTTFNGNPLEVKKLPSQRNTLTGAQITEWPLGSGISHIHDIMVASSGLIYGVDMSVDELYILSPETGELKKKAFPKAS